MRPLSAVLAAITVVCAPIAAKAQVTSAAWAFASTYCEARSAGVAYDSAMKIAVSDNARIWGTEFGNPNFGQLAAHQAYKQCPQYLGR